MEDQLIIKLFFQRSENAIEELAQKYGKLCNSISINILKNKEDAEECVNDTWLAVWNTVPPKAPNPLQAYVCKITRNLSLKKYYSNTAQKRNNYYDVILEEITECLESDRNVEEDILAKELEDEINFFLTSLKKKERVLFVLRYWYCFSPEEIAKKMQMSTNAVAVCLHRTRGKLQKYLTGREDNVS